MCFATLTTLKDTDNSWRPVKMRNCHILYFKHGLNSAHYQSVTKRNPPLKKILLKSYKEITKHNTHLGKCLTVGTFWSEMPSSVFKNNVQTVLPTLCLLSITGLAASCHWGAQREPSAGTDCPRFEGKWMEHSQGCARIFKGKPRHTQTQK